jgi:hypothetical protein
VTTTQTRTLRLLPYARISVIGRRDEAKMLSGPVQYRTIKAALENIAAGATILWDGPDATPKDGLGWYYEPDVSGKDFDRPRWLELLERIKRGEADGVIVWRLDRYGREITQCLTQKKELETLGAVLVSAAEQLRSDNPAHEEQMLRSLVDNHIFLRRVTNQWIVTHDMNHEDKKPHGRIAAGYMKGEDGALVPHPEFGPKIKQAFEQFADGARICDIRRWLESERVPHGTGSTRRHTNPYRWPDQTVRKMFTHRVYLGQIKRGDRDVILHAHEAIIDQRLWDRVQARFEETRVSHTRLDDAKLLTGLLRCRGCRRTLKCSGTDKNGKIPVYACKHQGCPEPTSVSRAIIEQHVEDWFWEHVTDVVFRATSETPDRGPIEEALDAALEDYRDVQRDRQWKRDDAEGHAEEAERLNAVVRAHRKALAEIDEAEHVSGLPSAPPQTLRELWKLNAPAANRDWLAAVIDTIVLRRARQRKVFDPTRVHIFVRGQAPEYRSGAKRIMGRVDPFDWDD